MLWTCVAQVFFSRGPPLWAWFIFRPPSPPAHISYTLLLKKAALISTVFVHYSVFILLLFGIFYCCYIFFGHNTDRRSQCPRDPRRGSAVTRLLRLRVRIPSGAWMYVCCESCVVSGSLFVGLITCPEETYRVWGVWVWSWSLENEGAVTHWGLLRLGGKRNNLFTHDIVNILLIIGMIFIIMGLLSTWKCLNVRLQCGQW